MIATMKVMIKGVILILRFFPPLLLETIFKRSEILVVDNNVKFLLLLLQSITLQGVCQ